MNNQRKSVNMTVFRTVLGFLTKISSKLSCFACKKGCLLTLRMLARKPILPTTVASFPFNLTYQGYLFSYAHDQNWLELKNILILLQE